jgi:hypothetical protein
MLKLKDVTLIALTGLGYMTKEHVEALEQSSRGIDFGAVKLIQLKGIKNIDGWNKAIIYELPKYVETSHCLLIHHDGYVINPDMWENEWLNYDYIGAPWPLPQDSYSYLDEEGELQRVGNSVSLRSKKLMDLTTQREWKPYYGNTNEDGFICCHNRKWLESQGCKFAPIDVAKYFSKEHTIEENKHINKTFAFHSL